MTLDQFKHALHTLSYTCFGSAMCAKLNEYDILYNDKIYKEIYDNIPVFVQNNNYELLNNLYEQYDRIRDCINNYRYYYSKNDGKEFIEFHNKIYKFAKDFMNHPLCHILKPEVVQEITATIKNTNYGLTKEMADKLEKDTRKKIYRFFLGLYVDRQYLVDTDLVILFDDINKLSIDQLITCLNKTIDIPSKELPKHIKHIYPYTKQKYLNRLLKLKEYYESDNNDINCITNLLKDNPPNFTVYSKEFSDIYKKMFTIIDNGVEVETECLDREAGFQLFGGASDKDDY